MRCIATMMSQMGKVDVVVVGAGPAGLSAAERTARAGLRTVVVEKNEAIGVPVRTSGGSWIADMRQLGIPSRLYHSLHRLRLMGPCSEVVFEYDRPLGCVLDVRGLYQYLGEQAIGAGAAIRLKSRAERPLRTGEVITGVNVHDSLSQDYDISARIVVDASGYIGQVGKRAGVHPGYDSFGFGAEYDLYAPHYDESEVVLIVGNQVAPSGYAWAFPYGNHRVRVGVAVTRPQADGDPREYLESLADRVPKLGRACRGASAIELHTGLIPILPPDSMPLVADGLVMVGDAAGQASSLVGEGIRFAIRAGRMAGDIVVKALREGNTSASFLRHYERAWQQAFARNLRIAYAIHRRITLFHDDDWENVLAALSLLTPRQFAQGLHGDYSPGWAIGIMLHHPLLAGKLVRYLVRSP